MKKCRESEFISRKHFKEVLLNMEDDGVEFVNPATVLGYVWTL